MDKPVQELMARKFFSSLKQDEFKAAFFNRILKSAYSADSICNTISDLDDAAVFDLVFTAQKRLPKAKLARIQRKLFESRGLAWFVSNYSSKWKSSYTLKSLVESGVFDLSDIRGILDFIHVPEVLLEVFGSFNDFEVVFVISQGCAYRMAGHLIATDIKFRNPQTFVGSQLFAIQRFVRLFPFTKRFFIKSYLEFLDDTNIHRLQFDEESANGKVGVRWFHHNLLFLAAHRIGALGLDGVDTKLALLAKRSLLRWFALFNEINEKQRERILKSELSREVGLKHDAYFYTVRMDKTPREEAAKYAKRFYDALRKLGCIVNPYAVESLELGYQDIDTSDPSSLSRFLFFDLGRESSGLHIPERLTFVGPDRVSYEIDILNGKFRTGRDSFIHDNGFLKGDFSLLSADTEPKMESAFRSLLYRRADFSTLAYLSHLTGLPAERVKLSSLSYDIYRNRVRQLLAWAGSSASRLKLVYDSMWAMRENIAFVSSLSGMEDDFKVFSALSGSDQLLTQQRK